MSKLDKAKALFDEIFNKAKVALAEDTVVAPKVNDERPDLEDGEHVEGDFIITVVDKVITEVKEKEKVEVEEVEDPVETDPVEEVVEDVTIESTKDKLVEMLGLANIVSGSFSLYGSIEDGVITYGDVYTTDWKVLMEKQTEETEAKEKELEDLKLQLVCKDKVITALSEDESPVEPINLNPAEEIIEVKPMTRKEALRKRL